MTKKAANNGQKSVTQKLNSKPKKLNAVKNVKKKVVEDVIEKLDNKLVPVQEQSNKPAKKDNSYKFLNMQEQAIVLFLAKGHTDKEACEKFGIKEYDLDGMRNNPVFVKALNEKILSQNINQKVDRIAKTGRITEAYRQAILEKLETPEGQDELKKMSLSNLQRLFLEMEGSLERKLGEDRNEKQNINILITDVVRKNAGKNVASLEELNPDDDFPIYDLGKNEYEVIEQKDE